MDGSSLAKDIMNRKIVTLSPQTHVLDGIRLLLRNRITGAPVVGEDDEYLGVFSEKCCMGVLTLIARLAAESDSVAINTPLVRDFMVTDLVTVAPQTDVFEAIDYLLKNRISGAPVVDEHGTFLGVFSEKTSMRVLVDAAYEQIPSTEVAAFANTDFGRVVSERADLLECAQVFIDTPYRRLAVLRDGKLVGQLSRRDVLANVQVVSAAVQESERILLQFSDEIDRSDGVPGEVGRRLATTEIQSFMSVNARTISEDADLLSIAQIFLSTPYRRLPVLRDGQLVGQISRRDLLQAMHRLLEVAPPREKALLYLSSLLERSDAPIE